MELLKDQQEREMELFKNQQERDDLLKNRQERDDLLKIQQLRATDCNRFDSARESESERGNEVRAYVECT